MFKAYAALYKKYGSGFVTMGSLWIMWHEEVNELGKDIARWITCSDDVYNTVF